MSNPTLYVIPTPLGPLSDPDPQIQAVVGQLTDYVGETAKNTRRFLKTYALPVPLQSIQIEELNEHTLPRDVPQLLAPLKAGRSLGLVSDAGCPGIADPGALLVKAAHQAHFPVVPLIGPCSLTLALMGSGLDGQRHQFHGYLPTAEEELHAKLKQLERASRQQQATMMFIETPYRNERLFKAILRVCQDDTWLCMASNLTQPEQQIHTFPLWQWKKNAAMVGQKIPTVFLLKA